jgi:hypothetical protein
MDVEVSNPGSDTGGLVGTPDWGPAGSLYLRGSAYGLPSRLRNTRATRGRPRSGARSRGREDGKFERAGGNALLLAQRNQKARQLAVGQCGVVLDPSHLAARRQQLVEMTAPAGGVLALPMLASASTSTGD